MSHVYWVVAYGTFKFELSKRQKYADPWYQVAFILTTGVNSAYVLGYSGSVMVPLGWIGGTVGLVLAAAFSMYANCLLARLHETGGMRHIRYRDLAGHIYGTKEWSMLFSFYFPNFLWKFSEFNMTKETVANALHMQVGKHMHWHGHCSMLIFSWLTPASLFLLVRL